ncbi:SDR family NAD(P)-dependent oxidoreductase [Mycobacterium sp. NPDC050441]|uniref:SDR family NAD(P)-dependent oxidoreductase n=1 Tax=Mycobacterium sp. NPDC050441 TaxID=3155403 RepID=UPI0033EC5D9D
MTNVHEASIHGDGTTGRLDGKIAFVAGASRGIGATIARTLAAEGAAVAVAARSQEQGKLPGTIGSVAAAINEAGGRALPVACDVTDEESVNKAVAKTVSEFGGIDILVANAGVLWLGPIETTPLKRWQLCLDVNLTGVFLVTKAVIPEVRNRGGGSLIAITTTGVDMVEHGANAYWVSKAAAERLYLGLAADLRGDNIAVNCLSPSRVVLTEGWQAGGSGLQIPPEMVEPPEAMGLAAVRLAGQDASGVTGTVQRSEALTF